MHEKSRINIFFYRREKKPLFILFFGIIIISIEDVMYITCKCIKEEIYFDDFAKVIQSIVKKERKEK